MSTPEPQAPKTADGRPVLSQPNTPLENALLILAVAGVLVGIFVLATTWAQLPTTVPTHFGVDGKPERLWRQSDVPGSARVQRADRRPAVLARWQAALLQLPRKITDENAARQYHAARLLMRILAFLVAWIFAYITYAATQSALTGALDLNLVFLFASLASVFGVIVVYIVIAVRLR